MPLKILSPLDGWCATLDEVPDAVFSQRMLGDGLAIDPTGSVVIAPCDGEIVTLPASGHAVSIRGPQGIDVLIHVGIDTVQLGGRGFTPLVKPGDRVKAGAELLRIDLDILARAAKSLMTPVVVTSEGVILQNRRAAGLVKAGEALFEIAMPMPVGQAPIAGGANGGHDADGGDGEKQQVLIVPLRQGLHARPAALLVRSARAMKAEISLAAHGRTADACSVVAIMALGVRQGDELRINARGYQAAGAIDAMIAAIKEAERLEAAHGPTPPREPLTPAREARVAQGVADGDLTGICAVQGFAVGRAARIERREIAVVELGSDPGREREELERARTNVRRRLERVRDTGGAARREIIASHVEFLDDPTLNERAQESIAAGKSAAFAWREATRRSVAALEALEDPRLRERADDLLDVEAHVLLALAGEARPMHLPLPENAVLLADDLLPSELTALDQRRLAAIVLSSGGATSHVAILAAAMEIPMLIGVGPALRAIPDGQMIIVDADQGKVQAAPDAVTLARAKAAVEERLADKAALRLAAAKACRSLDGKRVEVFANVGNVNDAAAAVTNGAEGCGLLRTEFLFIDREMPPSESEQVEVYQSIANALAGRPLILRMMDVGGDKPLRYLPLPPEPNPALGLRGVRTALLHPDLMRTQLRAALRVQPFGVVRLLVPMVTDVSEILAVRGVVDELSAELKLTGRVALGAMIETPAAALTASALMSEVDFLSIGSNDLTQYTLAMDRGHSELARRTDALHPAVLKLMAAATAAANASGKLAAVCGGVAGDSTAVPILLGLGIGELSVVPALIPMLKHQIGTLRIDRCRELAQQCLSLASAVQVRELVERSLAGLGEVS
jgi:phosphocarrier protein FPr/phosphocarrier protein